MQASGFKNLLEKYNSQQKNKMLRNILFLFSPTLKT